MGEPKQAALVDEYRHQSWTFYHLRSDMPATMATWIKALTVDDLDVAWIETHRAGSLCTALE